ncbi:MAG: phage major capsid protein [Clostridia bacterium]|nr:phage major capsid protein [Clostridia bacterium]
MANFDNIKLEKGMYQTTSSFTKELERLDPSEQYAGTRYEKLDAFQRQLKRFDIKVSGPNSDTIEKFFRTTDSAALFPEYVSRAVRQGMQENDLLPRIVAATTKIDGMDYRSISTAMSDDDKELKDVAEGAFIPKTTIKTQENLIKLHKRGRMLAASYEAIRFQHLDVFTVTLRQIGAYIQSSQLKDAISVLINGDGNNNAASSQNAAAAGTLTYSDIISFWNSFDPYELNAIIASPDVCAKILSLSEFRDACASLDFHASGKMITPVGADLMKSSSVPSGKMIGLDKNCALEMVTAGDVFTEYDKLIDRQLERTTITSIAGFSKIFTDASKILSV